MAKRSTITIINNIDYLDLRQLSTSAENLNNMAARYKLEENEAVCFSNFHRTRFRLLVNIAGIIHLAIPGRDADGKYDQYLLVADRYCRIVTKPEATDRLQALKTLAEERKVKSIAAAKTMRAMRAELGRK